ncbi:glucosaminidase domain-containing protein [Cohnella suwonensis]|uniref:Glucosaminidase domain-containing protein n=1 Tax=Cohnella suwonensis TaxID=696072 RepID=A0ABW0M0W9_9BACL
MAEKVGEKFRGHPELEPSGKLSIIGQACCDAERMSAYVRRRNPQAPKVAEAYLRIGQRYGIRGDVAFCQTAIETRGWTSGVTGPWWAPLGADRWTEESSIETRMRLLYAMATSWPLPEGSDLSTKDAEVLEREGWRGAVLCWEDLGGKWSRSVQSYRYGHDIAAMWRSMLAWRGKGEVVMERAASGQEGQGRRETARDRVSGVDWSPFGTADMKWLQAEGLLPAPAPHPDRKVTWAELATALRGWENRAAAGTMERNDSSRKEG